MMVDRRGALRGALRGAVALAGAGRAGSVLAQAGSLFPFAADDGRQVYNYRLPSDLSVEGLPGVVWTGARHPDVILVEYFDYNCPFCRKAERDIDGLLRMNPGLSVRPATRRTF